MKTSVEDISTVKKKLTIEISAEKVDEKVEKAYKSLGKRAKIKGFRPGKVPKNILERYFGKELQEDVTKELVNETLPSAMEETNTTPLTMPVVENGIMKTGHDFKYSAIMEVKPEFELKDYMDLEAEKEILAVTDDDVKKHLEEIRKSQGNLVSLEKNRAVKEEDYAVLDYEGFEDGKAIEGIKSENYLLRVGSSDFHPEFEKALLGLKKGDRADIKVTFDKKHYHPSLSGKDIQFKVKLQDVKVMELPDLDDKFAASLGAGVDTLEELEKRIKEDLIKREEIRIDSDLKKRLLQKISEKVDFELPESLVEDETRNAIENLKQNLIRSGSNMEKAGISEERMRKEFKSASEKRVKNLLILGEIAKQKDLTIDDVELTDGFRDLAEKSGQDLQVVRKYYEANRLLDAFRERLLEEKTLNYLVKGAKVNDIKAEDLARDPD